MRFSEEDTVRFAELYRKHECLWNVSLPDYKVRGRRNDAVESIIKEMNKPGFGVAEVKSKIKSLRSTYNQEVAKIRKSVESGSRDVYSPALRWFEILEPVMKAARDSKEIIGTLVTESYGHEDEYSTSPQRVMEESVDYSPEPAPQPALEVMVPDHEDEQRGVKRKLIELSNVRSLHDNCETDRGSEAEVFGRYVSVCLSGLPAMESVLAQQEIQAVLTKYRVSLMKGRAPAATDQPTGDGFLPIYIQEFQTEN